MATILKKHFVLGDRGGFGTIKISDEKALKPQICELCEEREGIAIKSELIGLQVRNQVVLLHTSTWRLAKEVLLRRGWSLCWICEHCYDGAIHKLKKGEPWR
jgi:hypothetical protein